MRSYLRIVLFFKREWPLIAILLVLVATSVGIGLLQAWPMAVLVDAVLTPTPSRGWIDRVVLAPFPKHIVAQLLGVTLLGMLLKVSQDGLTLVKSLVNRKIEFGGLVRVRTALFRHLQSLGPDYHREQPQGDAIYRTTFDSNGFKDALNVLINTAVAGARLLIMVSVMVSRSVPLTLAALSIFPVLIYLNRIWGPRLRKRSAESKQQETDYTTVLQRSMSVMGLVQAFSRERREYGRFKKANNVCARGWMRLTWETEAYWFLVRTTFSIGTAIILAYGGYLVYRDQFVLMKPDGVRVGDLIIFLAYLGDLWTPLQDLASFTGNISPPMAAVDRVEAVLNRKPLVTQLSPKVRLPRTKRELALDDVRFEYSPDHTVLRGVTADIAPGQLVAFVGPSGAGKSTLLNLFNRFYDPTHGRVLLDGQDIRNFRLSDIRRHIALVPQDSQLLTGTIAANIAFGRTGATQEQVRHAAEMAGAHEFVVQLPHGYHTQVTEGGQNLSGGQRQRLAIARAILSEAPVMVLDEPTSALDPYHTQQILQTLHRLRRHRTVVLVTHHLASVSGCDQIFVLSEGQVVERGSHRELLDVKGMYASMLAGTHVPAPRLPRLHEAA